ncbi:MAG: hypothetical protein JSV49_03875 [Thermoplasmata archaeon]|nr:MAG: hypothetical protein JSV49_03875 [Thermoplasmata archaeon]
MDTSDNGGNLTLEDKKLEILKMEYQICRNKIDDLDNVLKDIRFQGISVITGFTGAIGFLFSYEYYAVTILLSLFTLCLIAIIWCYDHKFFMFLLSVSERVSELEMRFRDYNYDGENMISIKIASTYDKLDARSTHAATLMYILFIITIDCLMGYYLVINILESLNTPFTFILLSALIISIIFASIYFMHKMWEKREQAAKDLKESTRDRKKEVEKIKNSKDIME